MSNYEHLFEIAIRYISDEKDFNEFKDDSSTWENIITEFDYIDSYTDRCKARDDTLLGIWDIANYVTANYKEGTNEL